MKGGGRRRAGGRAPAGRRAPAGGYAPADGCARWLAIALSALALATTAAACGLDVQGADLFLLTRTGGGAKLSLLINDSGTISCNGASPKPLPDPLLLQARDLATSLDADAKAGLRIAQSPGSVYRFTVKLADGTIAFPDRAAARHPELARTELFALQAATSACGSR